MLLTAPKSGKEIKPVKPANYNGMWTNDLNRFQHITILS